MKKILAKSILKISVVLMLALFALNMAKVPATNSFFTDSSETSENSFSSGYWIPELQMAVSPEEPDGEDGFYKTTPCVTLSANIHGETDGITIFYEFSDDGDPIDEGTVYPGTCVDIPDGNPTHFQAQAYNDENHDWLSNIVSEDFKVRTGVQPGDVVINELMWMGSSEDADDEWIELRNMTDHEIDLSNWDIVHGGVGAGGHIEIPHGYSIKANDYFLIIRKKWDKTEINLSDDLDKDEGRTHVSGMNLKNSGEDLILKNKDGDTIDTAWKNDAWPDGENEEQKKSMERNDDPEDGTDADSWHTCEDEDCNDGEYWRDDEGDNYGTPGADNLSGDDSESADLEEAPVIEPEVEIPPVIDEEVVLGEEELIPEEEPAPVEELVIPDEAVEPPADEPATEPEIKPEIKEKEPVEVPAEPAPSTP